MPEETSQEQWAAVDAYIAQKLIGPDPVLDGALAALTESGLPPISVSPAQGRQLFLLAKLIKAANILELGTLGAYSSICLARALPPGGRLITLEANAKHAEVARANIARAGLEGIVEVREGKALNTLPKLAADPGKPFDLIFIDADKKNIPEYFLWALKLARSGSLILVDNVVRKGALADAGSSDPDVKGARRFHEMLASEPRVIATTIQTVGVKGYDGFTAVLVL